MFSSSSFYTMSMSGGRCGRSVHSPLNALISGPIASYYSFYFRLLPKMWIAQGQSEKQWQIPTTVCICKIKPSLKGSITPMELNVLQWQYHIIYIIPILLIKLYLSYRSYNYLLLQRFFKIKKKKITLGRCLWHSDDFMAFYRQVLCEQSL